LHAFSLLNGSAATYLVLKFSIESVDAGDTCIDAIIADITELSEMKNALRQGLKSAEPTKFTKASFLVRMSHVLRTPLNPIIGLS